MVAGKAGFVQRLRLPERGAPPAQDNGQGVEEALDLSERRRDCYKERSHSLPFLCNVSSRFLCSIRPQETQPWLPWRSCDWGKWQRGQVHEACDLEPLAPPSMRGRLWACPFADRYGRLPVFTV